MPHKSYNALLKKIKELEDELSKLNMKTQVSKELNVQLQHKLVDTLASENKKLKTINKTFKKFVPQQFLDRIAKDGLENINLNKAEEGRMAILFSDIRSFTTISEKLKPQETLILLNKHFTLFNEIVTKNNGFVDKYIGDEIMALFGDKDEKLSDTAFNAITSAIEMQESLKLEISKNSLLKLDIGIGIHIGKIIVGTVGSEERMDSTVVGDAVNISSRLQELTKRYNSKIIISESTWRILDQNKHNFLAREIDKIHLRGSSKPIRIIEIYNSEEKYIIDYKQKTKNIYNKALTFFYKNNWEESMKLFEKCLLLNSNDYIARSHFDVCVNEITKEKLKIALLNNEEK